MNIPNLLLVEEDKKTQEYLENLFCAEGYNVFISYDGESMHQVLDANDIDLIIMDINLPGKNGLLLAREIREQTNIALMFLTKRDNDIDRILGLEIGADDYIVKPFNPRELTIRARNLLSRTLQAKQFKKQHEPKKYTFNNWILDTQNRSLFSPDGNCFKLPKSEFRAMLMFLKNPNRILSRSQLLQEMTGREFKQNDRTVDVTIRRIRKHFIAADDEENIITTIHGEGYKLAAQEIATNI